MKLITVILFALMACHTVTTIIGQQIEGRHLRPYMEKCDRERGCALRGGYVDESDDRYIKPADTKPPLVDSYRSIASGSHLNTGEGLKFGGGDNSKPGIDSYDRRPLIVDKDRIPSSGDKDWRLPVDDPSRGNPTANGGYNRKPINDEADYVPELGEVSPPIHGPKPDAYRPVSGGGGYNSKPARGGNGGYNPRPIPKEDHGTGSGGYLPKPEVGRDSYIPRPVEGDYRPGSHGVRDPVSKPITGSVHRPKPAIVRDYDDYRPTAGGGYYKPDNQNRRPIGPEYPNKDLGGYHDPKDEDFHDDKGTGIGMKDVHDDVKPIPVIEGGNCICVPYYQCQDGHIVTDGSGIIDARKRPEPDEELPLDGKFNPPSCGPFHVCCNTPETSTVKPYEHRCGVRNPSGINSRILSPSNKGEADFGEWPWQAAVLKSEGKINIFMCGGVLIDKLHVLTVAHCVFHLYKFNEYPLKVRLGEWDTQTTTEFLAHEDYRVSKIIVHPEYKNTSLWNDVAILRLEEPVLFAPHIDTVCLPKYDEIFSEQNCVITGWGKDAYKGGTFSNIMKEVALQVIDNYKCEEMLRKTRLGRFFQLHEGFLCAGGEYGLDSCKGDGGGPLVCYRKDKSYALAGLVSWGIDCGQPGVPGVYVKIQKYLEWISKNTGVALNDYWPKH